jgi:peptidoglycan hydrolase-like protein with peptidoglycan-binding domain
MAGNLQVGSSGPEVAGLQTELNCRPPSRQTPLESDGTFGPRTLDRVREFQVDNGLAADGIVGPLTLAALDGPGIDVPNRSGLDCGCSDAGAPSLGLMMQQQFASAAMRGAPAPAFGQSRVASLVSFPARGPSVLASIPGVPSPLRPLTPAQKATAAVYGTSIDFSRVFISMTAELPGSSTEPESTG